MPDLTFPLELQAKLGFVYLCNETSGEPYESFKLQILDKMLFEGPSSIMYKKIIEEGIAPDFCPGFGYDTTTRQSTFTIGVSNVSEKDAFKI